MLETRNWAFDVFGRADLGDARRTRRLVRMAARAAQSPAGRVSEVFSDSAERQGAYDFLEHHEMVEAEAVSQALFESTARACQEQERVLVVLDGTSLTLSDRAQSKGFGSIGTHTAKARGLKVLNAVVLTEQGTMVGMLDQTWWTREQPVKTKGYRRVEDRESKHWRNSARAASQRLDSWAPHTQMHVLADREADASQLLKALLKLDCEFTIRSSGVRKVIGNGNSRTMREALGRVPVMATMPVALAATPYRSARTAKLSIRAAKLPIRLKDNHTKAKVIRELTVVWARERGREPATGRIEWLLLSNVDVTNAAEACAAVRRYSHRWRIEELHRSWKSGLCNTEQNQLRSVDAVIKWATVLVAVATRVERLRYLSREEPDAPAETVLTPTEIETLVLMKRNIKRRNETVSDEGLTVAKAVRWIADLGGYVGNNRSGKPGAITIGRGLHRLTAATEVVELLQGAGKLR